MSSDLSWSFGLINCAGKYLTAETFGFRINCNASSLKRKQIWFLETDGSDKIYIRSTLGRYLTTTAAGAFNGDAESKGANEQFEVQVQPDGRWALLSAHGYYAGGQGEKLDAYTKVIAEDRLWTVQLAMHPQVNLRNVNRKRYVHLADNGLHAEEDIPWGDDATVTMVFFEGGKYGIQASNGSFLSASGALKANPDPDTRFILKFHGEQVSFTGSNGQLLTALGAKGTLKANKQSDQPSKDELWVLQDSHPQLKLKSSASGKRVSVRTGVEVSANQADATDAEFFQIEINKATKQWSFRTHKDSFWTVGDDGTINGNAKERNAKEWFDVEWKGAVIAIKACNGKYIGTKPNGGLIANSSSNSDANTTFIWEIINRPRLVLRGEHGFLGTLPSGVVECNKSNPEIYTLHVAAGVAHISGSNGKYWQVNGDNISCSGDKPTDFFLEMVEHSKMLIRYGDKYLQGSQNGGLKFSGSGSSESTLWEY